MTGVPSRKCSPMRPGVVVGARVQRGDPVGVDRVGQHGSRTRLHLRLLGQGGVAADRGQRAGVVLASRRGHVAGARPRRRARRLGPAGLPRLRLLVGAGVVRVGVGIAVLVEPVGLVLDQAEVDGHLPHRAGHAGPFRVRRPAPWPDRPTLPGSTDPAVARRRLVSAPADQGSARRRLPERRAPTEQRRAHAYVCRARGDRGLEVAAHPGRDPARPPDASARSAAETAASRANAGAGSAPSGATPITPQEAQGGRLGDQARPAPAPRPGSRRHGPASPSRATSSRTPTARPASAAPRSRAATRSRAVDGVHHVGVAGDRAGLVGLQLSDEVPDQPEVGAGRGLGPRLLVAVLPHVARHRASPAGARRRRARSW